jgi:TetR/AcrR family transcriptional regulator
MVQAAIELAEESEAGSFTVQDVLTRANVSLQTFYRHFHSKDELLVAVIEESVSTSSASFRATALRLIDPVARMESIVRGPFASLSGNRLSPMVTREHLRLMDNYAREVRAADEPYRVLLRDTILDAQESGRFPGIDAAAEAELIMSMVLSRYHNLVLGVETRSYSEEADHVWAFCLAALSREEKSRGGARGTRRA